MEVWRTYSAGQGKLFGILKNLQCWARKALCKSGGPTKQGKESPMNVWRTYSAGKGKLYGSLEDLQCRTMKAL
ncbi:hypothetical protein DPMN_032796 [Dreissena polymorpha]|uniref:Uncharacterized protein n=1 Tax=Dreissena polymorpha TaxID=45954 RepID=A0A9D4RKF4_DREPO|nr:hypothetical protein DPMN_032796 [Dreissena polymorpha]